MQNINLTYPEPVYLEKLVSKLVGSQDWISGIHVLDLGTPRGQDLFQRSIPHEWQEYIHNESVQSILDTLSTILLNNSRFVVGQRKEDVPQSLYDWIEDCNLLALSRIPDKNAFEDTFMPGFNEFNDQDCASKGLNRKKLHEVDRLSKLIFKVSDENDIDVVIDLGSGLGYLTHEIAMKYPIIGIESEESRNDAALRRTFTRNRMFKTKTNISLVTSIANSENLHDILVQGTKGLGLENKENINYLLTGLHACGDLSARTMSDFFAQTACIKAIVSVGCCYQHMGIEN